MFLPNLDILVARRVCSSWDSTVTRLLSTSEYWTTRFFLRPLPCGPIDRGLPIRDIVRPPGCSDECNEWDPCTTCNGISHREEFIVSAVAKEETLRPWGYRTYMGGKGENPNRYWLDLSQCTLNPMIRRRVLSSRQWQVEDGRLDLRLAPFDILYPTNKWRFTAPEALWKK